MIVGEQTTAADRRRRAGERVWMGLSGPALTGDELRLIREIQPSGYVLFARNVASPDQVLELNRELRALSEALTDGHRPCFVSVDQEGGRVQRVRATPWPPMRVVGRAHDLTERISRAMARELRAMGFHVNLAPVADVDSNPANPIIGDRSFDRDPQVVSRHVAAFIRAHQAEGMIASAKHFPGHGDTRTDSHLELPIVEREAPDLERTELPPFQAAVDAGVGTVMSAHVVFPAWDEAHPATMSARIIPEILRRRMGFGGVVLSDDMEMKAICGRYPLEMQLERATAATVDVFLCCKEPQIQLDVFEGLIRAQEQDQGFFRATEVAARRVHALRERFLKHNLPPVPLHEVGMQEHHTLALLARARGE